MARDKTPASRLIDNAVYRDERFLALDDAFCQLAYVCALGKIDTCGNLPADPSKLRQFILPGHALSQEDVCAFFNAFVKVGLAFYYERMGKLYIHFLDTSNKLYSAPMYPMPEGLDARKPERNSKGKPGGRNTVFRIYDAEGNECDVDGEPLNRNVLRVAPDYVRECRERALHMQCMYNVCTLHMHTSINRKERKGNEMNFSFPLPSISSISPISPLPEAGACLGGTPAPAEVPAPPLSEEQRRAFLEELSALKGDGHAE